MTCFPFNHIANDLRGRLFEAVLKAASPFPFSPRIARLVKTMNIAFLPNNLNKNNHHKKRTFGF
jgi:hypothetical protein